MDIDSRWLDHPMVREASARGDGTARATLTALHDIITEVEERFPGVPFGQILAGPSLGQGARRSVRNALVRNGVCEADIALILPPTEPAVRSPEQRRTDNAEYAARRKEKEAS